MDDFEYSVQISESDWNSFFRECEECALLPPVLAGVDDSDIDDVGSTLLDRGLKSDLGAVFLEIDAPLECKGPPVEQRLSKHGVGLSENVVSGNREDTHLRPVNRFFERLSSLTEAEQLIECSQTAAGEAVQGEEVCSDGRQANNAALPIKIAKLNSQPPSCEKEAGKETTEPHSSSSSTTNTTHKDGRHSKIPPELAAYESEGETDKSTNHNTVLFIREEDWPVMQRTQREEGPHPHDSPCVDDQRHGGVLADRAVLKQGPYLDKKSPMKLDVIHHDNSAEGKCLSVALPKKDPGQQSDTKVPSQELSPSLLSSKRKKRRKKRASIEPVEAGCGYERQFYANQGDSEDERGAQGTETNPHRRLSGEHGAPRMNETEAECIRLSAHQNVERSAPTSPSYSEVLRRRLSGNPPSKINAVGNSEVGLRLPTPILSNQELSEKCDLMERPLLSKSPPGHAGDSDLSTQNDGGNVETNLQPCSALPSQALIELKESPGSSVSYTTGPPGESGRSDRGNHATCQRDTQQEMNEDLKNMEPLPKDFIASPKHDTLVILEDIVCVISSDTQQLPAHNKIHQEFRNGPSSNLSENPTDVASANAAVEYIKLSLTDEPSFSEPDKIRRTKYRDDQLEYQSNIKADPTGCTEDYTATVSAEPLVPVVDPESSVNSHRSDEIMYTNMNNSVPDRNDSSLEVKDVSLSQSGSSHSNPSSWEGGGLEPNRKRITVQSGTNEADVSTRSPDSPSTADISELRPVSDVTSVDGTTRAKTVKSKVSEKAPDCKQSVYAMSSFWKDIDKLTINDILRVRLVSDAQPTSPLLQPLVDSGVADTSDAADSGYFTLLDDSVPDHSSGDVSTIADFDEDSNSNTDPMGDESPNSSGVLWERDPDPVSLGAGIYSDNAMFTSTDFPQSLVPDSAQKRLKKMYKNRSMQNLHALESFSQSLKGCVLPTAIAEEGESVLQESFSDDQMLREDSSLNSSFIDNVTAENYRISLTDIFQYIFGGATSEPCHSDTDNMAAYHDIGNSVPEMYDHFYSDYDAENFFCPLIEQGNTKDEVVPIFSCSCSANRNLQFPEAYDHFFPSSSSDDSCMESDEEDNEEWAPNRVVTRFTHKDSEIQDAPTGPDVYEHFFPDGDLGGNIFWKNSLSLRKTRLTGSTCHKLTSDSSLVPVNRSRKSVWRTIQPLNALGYRDQPFPDPLLYNLEDRIRQLTAQPLRCDDLQIAVANPRLDATLLPLKQSDMCLVCIAFASWVLKSANPQVGDAWKAVLLANISALSAIRYLRKYVREEKATREKAMRQTPSA